MNAGRALITGASRGIGAALARRMAKRGYEVWLAARSTGTLGPEVAAIESAGGRAHAFVLDVSNPEETEKKVAELDREVGGFDMVIANAGIGGAQVPVAKQTFAEVRQVMETNFFGALATILPLVPGMVERRRGHVVGISSLAGEMPLPTAAEYGTSKAAFSFYLACAAMDLAPHGVLVTDVHPGFVKTALTEKNTFKMPFIVELDAAADLMERQIMKGQRIVRFPVPLTTAITAGRMLPGVLRDRLILANRPR